jgi:hypothetical protein
MTVPEGWTHYQLYRETSTDGVATAGLIDDVTTPDGTPQHAISVNFADTRVAPINGNVIGSANYNAHIAGSLAWKCGTVSAVSGYPGVQGQTCLDPVGGFVYYSDADDHWKRAR